MSRPDLRLGAGEGVASYIYRTTPLMYAEIDLLLKETKKINEFVQRDYTSPKPSKTEQILWQRSKPSKKLVVRKLKRN